MTRPTRCPDCSGDLRDGDPFPLWCPACDWGVDAEHASAAPIADDRLRRAMDRLERECEQLSASELHPRFSPRRLALIAMAVGVHLVTVGCVAAAVVLWFTTVALPIRIVVGLLLVALAVTLRPRPGAIAPNAITLDRATSPTMYALVDRVAAAIAAEPVAVIAIDGQTNASITRIGLRQQPALTIGLPLWKSLDSGERLAVLGHEMAHTVNGDTQMGVVVGTASRALSTWHYLLRPERGDNLPQAGHVRAAAIIAFWVQVPLAALIFRYRDGMMRLDRRAGLRAEYLADELSARVAGIAATQSMLDVSLLDESIAWALRRAVRDDSDDPWQLLRAEVDQVPAAERERRRRRAGRVLTRVDSTHPPTNLRHRFVGSRPVGDPAVRIDAAESRGIDRELEGAGVTLLNRLGRQRSRSRVERSAADRTLRG